MKVFLKLYDVIIILLTIAVLADVILTLFGPEKFRTGIAITPIIVLALLGISRRNLHKGAKSSTV